ncbi:hypothetical protein GQ57_07140 [Burkholderia sp. MSh2]|nr:hypothetical protein GQ57_07140 [Burkholderia sp. MSh2]KFG96340.1 hypothetical protein GQ56_0115985 [Burkholderia paludis]
MDMHAYVVRTHSLPEVHQKTAEIPSAIRRYREMGVAVSTMASERLLDQLDHVGTANSEETRKTIGYVRKMRTYLIDQVSIIDMHYSRY